MTFWDGNPIRPVEVGFPLPNVLCELALAVPVSEARGVDAIDQRVDTDIHLIIIGFDSRSCLVRTTQPRIRRHDSRLSHSEAGSLCLVRRIRSMTSSTFRPHLMADDPSVRFLARRPNISRWPLNDPKHGTAYRQRSEQGEFSRDSVIARTRHSIGAGPTYSITDCAESERIVPVVRFLPS